MLKVLALAGAIAGGAVYGLYEYTDVFCTHCDSNKTCSLVAKTSCCDLKGALPSCCSEQHECCASNIGCCDSNALGSVAGTLAISAMVGHRATSSVAKANCDTTSPCCAGTKAAVAKKSSCCADPCPQCVVACEVCCPVGPIVCGDCCSVSAKTAVGGAAAVATTLKK
jgi:hypothetical protein